MLSIIFWSNCLLTYVEPAADSKHHFLVEMLSRVQWAFNMCVEPADLQHHFLVEVPSWARWAFHTCVEPADVKHHFLVELPHYICWTSSRFEASFLVEMLPCVQWACNALVVQAELKHHCLVETSCEWRARNTRMEPADVKLIVWIKMPTHTRWASR